MGPNESYQPSLAAALGGVGSGSVDLVDTPDIESAHVKSGQTMLMLFQVWVNVPRALS